MRGYIKGISLQQALLTLTENWKKVLDKKGFGEAILMNLSKAFDAIKHDLLIANFYALCLWQGYAIGPFLFGFYLNDLCYLPESTNVCNFVDVTTSMHVIKI